MATFSRYFPSYLFLFFLRDLFGGEVTAYAGGTGDP